MPFEIPENWVWEKLGNVGKWQAGGTPNRSHKEYYGGDIPWLKTGDLNDSYITKIPEYITQEGFDNSSVKLNPKNSILVALYGATIGKVGILTFPATTNQACCACVDYPALNKLYLFYFLRQHRDAFISQGGGGAQPNISKEIISNTFIPIPPFAEQQRIVAEIEKWFEFIDGIERNCVDLKEMIKQTKTKVLDLAIHGKLVMQDPSDEPASELLKRIAPNAKPCDTSHYGNLPFEIPKSWTWVKIKDIAVSELGKTLDRGKNKGKPYDYLCALNVKWRAFDLTTLKQILLEDDEKDRYLVRKGDLLICEGGDVGRAAIWESDREIYYQNALHRVRFKGNINQYFYLYILQYYKWLGLIDDVSGGVTIKHFTQNSMQKLLFPLPPIDEQNRIVQRLGEIFSTLDNITSEL